MKTYLMALFAAAMMLTGAAAMALGEEGSGHSSTAKLEVEELKPVVEEAATESPAAEAPAQAKPVKHYKRNKPGKLRSKELDFRHCLELEDNAAIAQCAQEQ